MGEIETCFTQAARFQLLTGEQSLGNIRLYSRLGYRILRTESAPGGVALVHMEKAGACDSGSE